VIVGLAARGLQRLERDVARFEAQADVVGHPQLLTRAELDGVGGALLSGGRLELRGAEAREHERIAPAAAGRRQHQVAGGVQPVVILRVDRDVRGGRREPDGRFQPEPRAALVAEAPADMKIVCQGEVAGRVAKVGIEDREAGERRELPVRTDGFGHGRARREQGGQDKRHEPETRAHRFSSC